MIYKAIEASLITPSPSELRARLGGLNDVPTRLREELSLCIRPAYVAERVELKRTSDGIFIGELFTKSEALMRVSAGFERCFLLVCTLGVGADRLIDKYSRLSPADAFMLDALSDAYVESLCDIAEDELCPGFDKHTRFSPGYADLELSFGEKIIRVLDAERILGIKLTDSGMMIPKKSVNAIVFV